MANDRRCEKAPDDRAIEQRPSERREEDCLRACVSGNEKRSNEITIKLDQQLGALSRARERLSENEVVGGGYFYL